MPNGMFSKDAIAVPFTSLAFDRAIDRPFFGKFSSLSNKEQRTIPLSLPTPLTVTMIVPQFSDKKSSALILTGYRDSKTERSTSRESILETMVSTRVFMLQADTHIEESIRFQTNMECSHSEHVFRSLTSVINALNNRQFEATFSTCT